ncbi:MAG: right-handed parallel beta-helix repeat-containing protein [Candidatus Omnitrophica bacterium]|nr:right-handed parallel beta-helix repeat-containing protein [Candidatus Omnitrophota bacterium]
MTITNFIAATLGVVYLTLAASTNAFPQPPFAQADFYVAPDGLDSNPGTASAPFATLAKARDAVRDRIAEGLTNDILVAIRGGTYQQPRKLVFGPEDSGTAKYSITYGAMPGETVIISGGLRLTGWKRGFGEIWTTLLPRMTAGLQDSYFRQLFVNGQRAVRARTPNANDKNPWWTIKSSVADPGQPDPDRTTFTLSVDHPIKAWKNIADVELVWIFNNDGSRSRLGVVNEAEQTFPLPPPHQWTPKFLPGEYQIGHPVPSRSCYFENALEMLDQPGEWYFDRQTRILSYWPRPGEDLETAEVVAPIVQNTLLEVAGTRQHPVQNLHFQGIRLAYVDWPLPSYGFTAMFGCLQWTIGTQPEPFLKFHWIDSALKFENARGCSFTDGAVEHAGAIGIGLLRGTAAITLEGNDIHDLGGGGIVLGKLRNRDTLKWADQIVPGEAVDYQIDNNHIHHCGTDYFGSIGIFMTLCRNSRIAHNLIHDIAYSGIVVSGNEDKSTPFAGGNVVEANHIHHVMQTAVDGAGIYVSFPQSDPGAAVRWNLIHDVQRASGIYLDAVRPQLGCTNYQFENNFIFQAGLPKNLCACDGSGNLWLDNSFEKGPIHSTELLAALEARTGLEPGYYRKLLGIDKPSGQFYLLTERNASNNSWSAWQFHWPERDFGVVRAFRGQENTEDNRRLKLHGLSPDATYEVTVCGTVQASKISGHELMGEGFLVTLAKPSQAATIIYKRID